MDPYLCPTLVLVFYGHTHGLQEPLHQPLQHLETVDSELEVFWRPVGDGLELVLVGVPHPDGEQNDPVFPETLRWHGHVIGGFAICDDHGDLRHAPDGATARLLGEILRAQEVDGLSHFRAAGSMRKSIQGSQQRRLVHVVLQQELLMRVAAGLSQTDTDFIRADVEARGEAVQKQPDLLKVTGTDGGGAVDQENHVSFRGPGTFWTGRRKKGRQAADGYTHTHGRWVTPDPNSLVLFNTNQLVSLIRVLDTRTSVCLCQTSALCVCLHEHVAW